MELPKRIEASITDYYSARIKQRTTYLIDCRCCGKRHEIDNITVSIELAPLEEKDGDNEAREVQG